MKFICEYRTRDNVLCSKTVKASSREAAYEALKADGIRPARLYDAPGVFNKLWGRGKRWIVICVLLLGLLGACYFLFALKSQIETLESQTANEAQEAFYEERGQLYGDPVLLSAVMKDDWASVFSDIGDQFLASYAIPCKVTQKEWPMGEVMSALSKNMDRRIVVLPEDHKEIAQMKRMVNQMRREMGQYIRDGGNIALYVKRVKMRQAAEIEIYRNAKRELIGVLNEEVWREKNDALRAKGLPMVAIDLD